MDSTLTKLIICKVGIFLVRCLNSKHRQTAWSVSSETTGDTINTEDVKKKRQYCLLKCIEVVLTCTCHDME